MRSNGIQGATLLRGLLALAVAFEHADVFGLGYFPFMIGRSAVIGFFVLSGWVMAWYFYSANKPLNKEVIVDFYLRRALRLAPVLLLNFVIVSIVMGKPFWWEIAGLMPISINAPAKFFNLVLWTLFVEIQFYCIVPWLVWFFKDRKWSLWQHGCVYAALFIIPRLIDVFGRGLPVESAIDPRSLVGTISYFYAGVIYCRMVVIEGKSFLSAQGVKQLWGLFALGAGVAAILFPISHVLYFCVGVHFIVLMTLSGIELSRRYWPTAKAAVVGWLRYPWWLGEISYGYYIFHGFCLGVIENHLFERWGFTMVKHSWPVYLWLIVVPVIFAGLSFWFVERPALKLRAVFLKKG